MTRILIVEDEPRIAEFLERGLAAHGYTTVVAHDGRTGLDEAHRADIDLVILDIGLPHIDGLDVLHALRGQGVTTPVLILTARGGPENTIKGLDAGADDYLSKPFRFDELLARVRARLRSGATASAEASSELNVGRLALDIRRRQVRIDGREVELSAREFVMLEVFLKRPGEVLSREQLLSGVWGYSHNPGSNVVDVYVGYLRKKLGDGVIITVRGMGYRFDPG
ncbi:response regulator transcription factor [Phytoactinopolyspora limicola]|uniref:response regulator transcription factor n=1 Tax=Phytoactinopolyspora limicola TaxID=2715536 RepID=UPI0014079DCA|nr:response regulator transcription factor [Phytoactinopolyspora limicola]